MQAATASNDTGLGGNTVTATITVTPVADTPSVTNASTVEDTQTTSGLVISRHTDDGLEVTHFKITAISGGDLFQNDGVTPISDGAFILVAQGNAGLKFTPAANVTTDGRFTVQASLSNTDPGLGGSAVNATITVTAVNDDPTAHAGGPYSIDEGSAITLDASLSTDIDSAALSYGWDLDGNDSFDDATGVAPNLSWAQLQSFGVNDGDQSYPIKVRVQDGQGGSNEALATIHVTDVAPSLMTSGAASVTAGQPYTLNLSASDPGDDTITGWVINWGDGTIETVVGNPSSRTHTYHQAGFTYNILASATDEDGAYALNDLIVPSYTRNSIFRFAATTGAFLEEFATSEGLDDPIEAIIGPDGDLYVSGERSDHVLRYDPATETFVGEFISKASGGLDEPGGMAFGPDGNLYVASGRGDEVRRYHGSTGAFIDAFVAPGSGGLDQPYSLTFGPDGHLYVASFTNSEVLRYDGASGAFLGTFVSPGSGGLNTPEQIVFGPDGHLYVTSFATDNILRYNGSNGAFIDMFVTTGLGGLEEPAGLAFGPDAHLYVADFKNSQILRYNGTTGAFIDTYVSVGSGGFASPVFTTFLPHHQVMVNTNLPPTISLSGSTVSYTENNPPTMFDATATATDPDSADFDTGTLMVGFTAGGTANDRLGIRDQGPGVGNITIAGIDVHYDFGAGPVKIGDFVGGTGSANPLDITFNTTANAIAVEAVLRNITYENVSNHPSTDTRTVRFILTDGDGGVSNAETKMIDLTDDNDDPGNTGAFPSDIAVIEDVVSNMALAMIDLVDLDAGTANLTLTLATGAGGSLIASTSGGVTVSGSGTVTLTLTGTVGALNTFIDDPAKIQYLSISNAHGDNADSLTLTVTDNGNTGLGGGGNHPLGTANIDITPVGDTPQVSNITTDEDTQSGPMVLDRHSGDGSEITHFRISNIANGSLFQNDGVTPINDNNYILVAEGQAGLRFTPDPDSTAPGSFDVESSEDGSNVAAQSNVATSTITVTPVADTPSVTNASTTEDTQTTSGLVISPNPADGAEVTHFKVTAISGGDLFQNDGTTPISADDFITVTQGNAGLKFTPAPNSIANGGFTVQAATTNHDTGLGGSTVDATISVTPVADTPSVTNSATLEDIQTTSGLVISRNPADGIEVTHVKITSITGGSLYQNDGITPINNGEFITVSQGGAGLKFTPAANSTASGNFTVQAATADNDTGLGGSTVDATISVTPVADTLSVTNATTLEDNQTSSGLVISRHMDDGIEISHFKITGITGGLLFQNDGITSIANNSFILYAEGNTGLRFTPTANSNTNGNITIQASTTSNDSGLGGSTVNATIAVTPVGDTPQTSNITTNEDTQSGPIVLDRHSDDGPEVTHFRISNITNGSLFQNNGTTPINNGDYILVAEGQAGLRFTPDPDSISSGSFDVESSEDGSNVAAQSDVATSTITITPVADTPSVTNASTVEDAQTTSGLVISLNPVDGPEVTHFKITAITGGTLFQNDGVIPISNGNFITVAQGNMGLKFTPTSNSIANGNFTVQASTSNNDTGLGGSTVNATITVAPVADTPSVTNASTLEDHQTTSGLVVSRNIADGIEVTHFKITAISGGTLYQNNGTTPINDGTFISADEGMVGLKFTPSANSTADGEFTVQAATAANNADLGGNTVQATIAVTPVNDDPVAHAGGPYHIDEGDSVTLDAFLSTDIDSVAPTYTWELDGDNSFDDVTGVSPTLTWLQLQSFGINDGDRSYPIAVRVDDGDGGSHTASATIDVVNISPMLTATGAASVTVGMPYTLNLNASDLGNDTITSWVINWGDGTIETVAGNPSSVTHIYGENTEGFTYNILASATDEDGTFLQNDLVIPSYTTDRLFRFKGSTGDFLQVFATADGLDAPIEAIIGPDGKLYVSGERSDDVLRYDATTGAFIDVFIASGGGLDEPGGMAFGPDGHLYVANGQGDSVLRYNGNTGGFIDVFVSAGSGGLDQPYGLTFGPNGHLYVASYSNHEVLQYNGQTGVFFDKFVKPGSGGLSTPGQIAFGPDDNFYVASFATDHVLRYDSDTGEFVDAFVSTGLGGLTQPTGLAFGPDGHLYVGDFANGLVRRYDGGTGTFIDDYIDAANGGLTAPVFITFLPSQQVEVNANIPPTLSLSGIPVAYTENSPPTVLDTTATVSDPDSPDFGTGTLIVDFAAGGTTNDRLDIRDQGPGVGRITTSGIDVRYDFGSGPIVIGTFVGGTSGSNPLDVAFNAIANVTSVEAVLRNITYQNVSDDPSTVPRTVRFIVTDGDGGISSAVTKTVTLTADNNDPHNVGTLPSKVIVTEDKASDLDLSAIDLIDVDAGLGNLTLTLATSMGGTLIASSSGGVAVSGSGATTLTLTGQVGALNAFVDDVGTIQYLSAPDANGNHADRLDIEVTDNGNAGAGGGGAVALGTIQIDITPIGDTPQVASATTLEDTQSGAIVLSPNPNDGSEVTHFRISNISGGALYQNNGVTAINNGDFITVNEGSSGLKFTPSPNSNATGSFDVESSEDGLTVAAQSGVATATIAVTPVADTPSVANAATLEDTATAAVLFISPHPDDGPEITHFKITNITGGTLLLADNATPVQEGDFITLAQGGAGLIFVPEADSNTDGHFNAQASTMGNDSGLGGDTAMTTITVVEVNDAPIANSATSYTVNENTSFTLHGTGLFVGDPDADVSPVKPCRWTALSVVAGTTGVIVVDSVSNRTTAVRSGSARITLSGTLGQINALFAGDLGATITYMAIDAPSPSTTLTLVIDDLGNGGQGGNLSATTTSTLTIVAENDPPTSLSLTQNTVIETTDSRIGHAVGTLSATDPDRDDSTTYSIVGGANEAVFSIDAANSLVLTDGLLDFETQPTYLVTVRVTDSGGASRDQTFAISVTDIAPAITTGQRFTILETAAGLSIVGTVATTGDTPTRFAITSGNINDAFVIDANGSLAQKCKPRFEPYRAIPRHRDQHERAPCRKTSSSTYGCDGSHRHHRRRFEFYPGDDTIERHRHQ